MITRSTYRAFAVLSILLIIGYAFFYLYTTSGSTATIRLSNDDPCIIEGGNCRESCLSNEYYDSDCFEEKKCCKKKEASPESDTYYYNLAINKNNLSLCNQIIDDTTSADCKLLLIDINYREFAFKIEDCDKISDTSVKAGCLTDIALKSSSAEACSFIQETSLKELCFKSFAIEKKEISYCTNEITNDVLKDRCYASIAISLKDNSICNKIKNERIFNKCIIASDPKVNYIDCTSLSEIACMSAGTCKGLYIKPRCEGCPVAREFESCTFDQKQLCELSNGNWQSGECKCLTNEAFFDNYGCLDCNYLIHDKAKELCQAKA